MKDKYYVKIGEAFLAEETKHNLEETYGFKIDLIKIKIVEVK